MAILVHKSWRVFWSNASVQHLVNLNICFSAVSAQNPYVKNQCAYGEWKSLGDVPAVNIPQPSWLQTPSIVEINTGKRARAWERERERKKIKLSVIFKIISTHNLRSKNKFLWSPQSQPFFRLFEFGVHKKDSESMVPGIQDSLGFWITRCGFRIRGTGFQYLSVELGFWIPIVGGIPHFFSWIPDPKIQDSGFQ